MYFKFMQKIVKKMLTELSDYVNIFLACDAHVQCASGSVVEHLLAKEGAAGSIPVSRFFFTFLGVFCVCTYIWKILKSKHFPKKINPIYKNKILTNNSLKVYNCNECLIK